MSTELSGAQWFKSTYSESGGQCVEVAWLASDRVGVRDSKNPAAAALTFTLDEWATFTTSIADSRFKPHR